MHTMKFKLKNDFEFGRHTGLYNQVQYIKTEASWSVQRGQYFHINIVGSSPDVYFAVLKMPAQATTSINLASAEVRFLHIIVSSN